MAQKYVVFDKSFAICFGDSMVHAGMHYCDQYTNPRDWERSEATSAGFFLLMIVKHPVHGEQIKVHVYGESLSLKLKSSPEDAHKIALALGIV